MSVGIFCREGVIRRWNGCNSGKEGDLGRKGGGKDKRIFLCDEKSLDFTEEGRLIFI
jgi:hypothetical protein